MAAAMDVRETIEELRAALAELESGEGLSRFVEGHGLQSRVFVFSWESEELSIDFVLPCERVLSDEEERALDALRVGSALRLAILLLSAADWERREVQRKVAGPPPAPLPEYEGGNGKFIKWANNAQRTIKRAVCPFRRDLLGAIAKEGWFEE